MGNIIDLAARRDAVTYTVTITQHWDGRIESYVHDVSDDERSRYAVADALMKVAKEYIDNATFASGDKMLSVMLGLIDRVMATSHEVPAQLTVSPDELRDWAEAVAEYEAKRFPGLD